MKTGIFLKNHLLIQSQKQGGNMEVWKDIQNYEGLYQVSNLGRIKALAKTYRTGEYYGERYQPEKIIKPFSNYRYLCVDLNKNAVSKKHRVHRIVAITFLENPNNLSEVNHINGDKFDNRAENLEWCTRSHNQLHAYSIGLQKVKHGAELTWSKRVVDTNTNVIYETISEAATSCNVSVASLSRYLNGVRQNKTSMRFYDETHLRG